uniref:hypothetical protein n=1 Tax=Bartonella sp. AD328YNZD TaxID=3243464 RepID=UPI0035D0F23A
FIYFKWKFIWGYRKYKIKLCFFSFSHFLGKQGLTGAMDRFGFDFGDIQLFNLGSNLGIPGRGFISSKLSLCYLDMTVSIWASHLAILENLYIFNV